MVWRENPPFFMEGGRNTNIPRKNKLPYLFRKLKGCELLSKCGSESLKILARGLVGCQNGFSLEHDELFDPLA